MAITYNEDGSQSRTITERKQKLAMDIFPKKLPKDIEAQLNETQEPKDGKKILKRLMKKIKKGQV